MGAICDRMHCGQLASYRLTGRPYCARHAAEIARSVGDRAGRAIVRLVPLAARPLGAFAAG